MVVVVVGTIVRLIGPALPQGHSPLRTQMNKSLPSSRHVFMRHQAPEFIIEKQTTFATILRQLFPMEGKGGLLSSVRIRECRNAVVIVSQLVSVKSSPKPGTGTWHT